MQPLNESCYLTDGCRVPSQKQLMSDNLYSQRPAHLRSWSLWEPCSHSMSSPCEPPEPREAAIMAAELSPLALEASGEDGCTEHSASYLCATLTHENEAC